MLAPTQPGFRELYYVHSKSPIFHTIYKTQRPGSPTSLLLRVRPSTAHLRTALVAAKARQSRADLCRQNGALVVHPVARLDAAHAAEAVCDAAATALSLSEHHKFLCLIPVPKSCDEILPCSVFVTEPQFQAMQRDP